MSINRNNKTLKATEGLKVDKNNCDAIKNDVAFFAPHYKSLKSHRNYYGHGWQRGQDRDSSGCELSNTVHV